MAKAAHQARPDFKIIAQLEVGYLDVGPSSMPMPFSDQPVRALSIKEIEQVVTSTLLHML
jgi:hypothetical protein